MKRNLYLFVTIGFLGLTILPPDAPGQSLQLVSLREPAQSPPAGGSGNSLLPLISPDGRYVLFASTANNLVVATNGLPIPALVPPKLNVYLRDRLNGTTALVSANVTGANGGNGDSLPWAVSSNGLYALFESSASDLVANDTNKVSDIFVRDLLNGTTTLVSASTNGVSGNGASRNGIMTPDGRYVAFVSLANNLVPGDTNKIADVFLRDLLTQTTTLVSRNAAATTSTPLSNSSESPRITPDGRYVAFLSTGTNLVPGVATINDVYVRDVVSGTTVCASANARAVLQSVYNSTNGSFYNHAISDDGKFIAFEGNTNSNSRFPTRGLILRFNQDTSTLDLVTSNAAVQTAPLPDIHSLELTPDGRFIAFVANTNGTAGTTTCINLWDGLDGTTTLVSGNLDNVVPVNSTCDWPALDATGRYLAFICNATNMVTNMLAADYHAYLRDVQTGTTLLMDADLAGMGRSVNPQTAPRLSADGRWVAFAAPDSNLVTNDNNRDYDIFIRDAASNAVDLVSVRAAGLPSASPNGLSELSQFSVDNDGTHFAFASEGANLVPNDTNGCRDIFVRNLVTGATTLATVSTNGINSANRMSSGPAMSAGGGYVAFSSYATDLVPGDANLASDVFVRNLQSGTTLLVSVATNGTSSGNQGSSRPAISSDGRYVLFRSKATTLASGPYTANSENLFLRDLQLGVTRALTVGG